MAELGFKCKYFASESAVPMMTWNIISAVYLQLSRSPNARDHDTEGQECEPISYVGKNKWQSEDLGSNLSPGLLHQLWSSPVTSLLTSFPCRLIRGWMVSRYLTVVNPKC